MGFDDNFGSIREAIGLLPQILTHVRAAIRILPREKVMLEVSPYDLSKGRRVFRRQ